MKIGVWIATAVGVAVAVLVANGYFLGDRAKKYSIPTGGKTEC